MYLKKKQNIFFHKCVSIMGTIMKFEFNNRFFLLDIMIHVVVYISLYPSIDYTHLSVKFE